jgi:hypothetical protein
MNAVLHTPPLPLFTPVAASADAPSAARATMSGFDATGFEIGWDHAQHRLTPPADHLHARHPVREGWEAGRLAFGTRTLRPTRAVQCWLQLRLQAWTAGLPFEALMLTPHYLAQLEAVQCPVTREVLTHEQGLLSDATVMRLLPAAGYTAGHLVVVSRRVAQARGTADAAAVAGIVRHLQAAGPGARAGGLTLAQWERLGGLLMLVEPAPHERSATRPLRVLPPNRLVVANPAQALQVLLTTLLLSDAPVPAALRAVAALMPAGEARSAATRFMSALLARRLDAGWAAGQQRLRTALEDAWCQPVIERRWEQLALRLSRADAERVVRQAAQRGLFGGATRWLDDRCLAEGWTGTAPAPTGLANGAPGQRGPAASAGAARDGRAVPTASPVRWTRAARSHASGAAAAA